MKANDVQHFLKSLNAGWVDVANTVDTFKSGSPDTEVEGIAVAWMSYSTALQKAIDLGCNLFITHEPTYYDHWDNAPEIFRFPQTLKKREWIEDSGLTIIRCHDLWDQYPGIGIPDAWGTQLGFSQPTEGQGYHRVYTVDGRTAHSIARQVVERTKHLGQNAVQFVGPQDVTVNRVVIGTGAITPFLDWVELYKPDLAICTDDGFTFWRDGAFAIDHGIPVVVVNHAVAEIYGIELLANLLRQQFHSVPVHFIPQSCMYTWIPA